MIFGHVHCCPLLPLFSYPAASSSEWSSLIPIQFQDSLKSWQELCRGTAVHVRRCEMWLSESFLGIADTTVLRPDLSFRWHSFIKYLPTASSRINESGFWQFKEKIVLLKKLWSMGIQFLLIDQTGMFSTSRLSVFWGENIKEIGLSAHWVQSLEVILN